MRRMPRAVSDHMRDSGTGDGEAPASGAVTARAGEIDLHWATDGTLALALALVPSALVPSAHGPQPPSLIAGGPLAELAPAPGDRRDTRVARPKPLPAPSPIGVRVTDALGTGTRWRRTLPLDGHPLALEVEVTLF